MLRPPSRRPPSALVPQFTFISCFLRSGEGFDCLTERSWKIGDTRSLDDTLQASWIKTEATANTNTTYEIIDLIIAADEQPEATANSTLTGKDVEGWRVGGVESNTKAYAGVDCNSSTNGNTNVQPSANSTLNSNSNSEPKISPDKSYPNASPTSPPPTTTGAQTTTQTEASESQLRREGPLTRKSPAVGEEKATEMSGREKSGKGKERGEGQAEGEGRARENRREGKTQRGRGRRDGIGKRDEGSRMRVGVMMRWGVLKSRGKCNRTLKMHGQSGKRRENEKGNSKPPPPPAPASASPSKNHIQNQKQDQNSSPGLKARRKLGRGDDDRDEGEATISIVVPVPGPITLTALQTSTSTSIRTPPKPLPKADTSSFFFIDLTPAAIPTVLIDTTLAVALDWSIAPDAALLRSGGLEERDTETKERREKQGKRGRRKRGLECLDYHDVRGITRYFDVAPNPNATLKRTALSIMRCMQRTLYTLMSNHQVYFTCGMKGHINALQNCPIDARGVLRDQERGRCFSSFRKTNPLLSQKSPIFSQPPLHLAHLGMTNMVADLRILLQGPAIRHPCATPGEEGLVGQRRLTPPRRVDDYVNEQWDDALDQVGKKAMVQARLALQKREERVNEHERDWFGSRTNASGSVKANAAPQAPKGAHTEPQKMWFGFSLDAKKRDEQEFVDEVGSTEWE
ncbi:hypothetical protein BJ165DRAFT_1409324 [Panaeolus papilionaceus]|nr:hypothetical protein BJ165DRAFT_1409324 [Panaeolus papilionaceus]